MFWNLNLNLKFNIFQGNIKISKSFWKKYLFFHADIHVIQYVQT